MKIGREKLYAPPCLSWLLVKDVQQAASPRFHPEKNVLYFTGQEATKSYIYAIDLDTEKVSKLTDGRLFIKAIDIAPNGKKLVYSAYPVK